jgi:hypothetical protein
MADLKPKCPTVCHFGRKDAYIPADEIKATLQAAQPRSRPTSVKSPATDSTTTAAPTPTRTTPPWPASVPSSCSRPTAQPENTLWSVTRCLTGNRLEAYSTLLSGVPRRLAHGSRELLRDGKSLLADKSTRSLCCEQDPGPVPKKVTMTLEQIKREIRSLNPNDMIELCRWLDYEIATDCSSSILSSRIGADRSREIRHRINQVVKINLLPASREPDQGTGASLRSQKNHRIPGRAA